MSDSVAPTLPKPNRAPTLYLIAGFKLFKGGLLILLAAGLFAMSDQNLGTVFDNFLRWVHLDPEKRFFAEIGDRLDTFTPANLRFFASGTLIYGCFLLAGGLGLALRAAWAIWLSIGESAFFIPVEIFEIVRRRPPITDIPVHRMMSHPKLGLVLVLIVNVIIVCYLFKNRERLFRHHHHPVAAPAGSPPGPAPGAGSSAENRRD